ncbi:MAG TPA: hypothetical protein VIX89_01715, partial [Bryobacteraceae bacterium]
LAILLAAPGIPVFGQPDRDATSLGIQAPGRVRADKRDATRVGISARGQNNQPVKDLLVTLLLVPKRGGPGLLTDTGEEMAEVKTGDDGIAWFFGLRSNGILGAFKIVAEAPGPNGRRIEKRKTIRNARGVALFGLSVKQLVSIAAGAAAVTTVVALTNSSTPPQPTVITPGPPIVTTGRKPRR